MSVILPHCIWRLWVQHYETCCSHLKQHYVEIQILYGVAPPDIVDCMTTVVYNPQVYVTICLSLVILPQRCYDQQSHEKNSIYKFLNFRLKQIKTQLVKKIK